jgi:hypothetical protein
MAARLAGEMFERIPGHEQMPPEIVRAIVGGVQKTVYKRLLRSEEERIVALSKPADRLLRALAAVVSEKG